MIHYSPHTVSNSVHWNIKIEPIFRILDDVKWMENFFESGELMLSCFNNFKKYPDEMQGDKREGEGFIGGTDEEGNVNGVIYESGLNAFIMSTTTNLNKKVQKDFNGKCAIKINNPTAFALEISKKLPFVNSGLEGDCNYEKSRTHFLDKEMNENRRFQNIDFHNDPNSHNLLKEITLGMELFLKQDKYKHQNEYRLIWFSDKNLSEGIFIKCPEAIHFCEKVYL
tara:strand:+ start:3699 stop:4373 length:675 start_codon:yes stop_codon:yes gene_type:complete